jgi:flagellar hook-associated protein 3 FlgL
MTIIGTSTSAFYDRSTQSIGYLRAQAEAVQQEIGRGERLTKSSDDPVAASRLRQLSRSDRMSNIDTTNATRAVSDLTLADQALSSFTDTVIRIKELATQAATTTLTDSQRAGIGEEIALLQGNLVSLANSRDSAGHALFGGEATGDAYTLDAAGNATYTGTASSGDLALGDGQSVRRGLTGPEFLNFNANGVPTNLMAVVKSLGAALQGGVANPAAAARDALTTLSDGLDKLTTGQTLIGARLAWIDLTNERRVNLSELRSTEQTEIGSTDIASSVSRLQQLSVVLEASQSSFSRLAQLSLFNLLS